MHLFDTFSTLISSYKKHPLQFQENSNLILWYWLFKHFLAYKLNSRRFKYFVVTPIICELWPKLAYNSLNCELIVVLEATSTNKTLRCKPTCYAMEPNFFCSQIDFKSTKIHLKACHLSINPCNNWEE